MCIAAIYDSRHKDEREGATEGASLWCVQVQSDIALILQWKAVDYVNEAITRELVAACVNVLALHEYAPPSLTGVDQFHMTTSAEKRILSTFTEMHISCFPDVLKHHPHCFCAQNEKFKTAPLMQCELMQSQGNHFIPIKAKSERLICLTGNQG